MHNRYFSISLNHCQCFQYLWCSRFTSNHFYSKFKNNSSDSGNSWVSSGRLCGLYWIIFEPPKTIKITWKDLKWLQTILNSSSSIISEQRGVNYKLFLENYFHTLCIPGIHGPKLGQDFCLKLDHFFIEEMRSPE